MQKFTFRAALVLLALFVLTAVFGPYLVEHDPLKGSLRARLEPPLWAGGSAEHLLGTDRLGRDMLARIVSGARISLTVCVVVIAIAGSIGTAIGTLSPSFGNIVLVISLVLWSQYARMARGETLRVKNEDYVDLARTSGLGHVRIIARHILPNIAPALIVVATLQVGVVIVLEASLSFLGVGVPPPNPSWGSMVADGRSYVVTAWWVSLFPGIAILLVVMAVNIVGDALTDRINPALRGRTA